MERLGPPLLSLRAWPVGVSGVGSHLFPALRPQEERCGTLRLLHTSISVVRVGLFGALRASPPESQGLASLSFSGR